MPTRRGRASDRVRSPRRGGRRRVRAADAAGGRHRVVDAGLAQTTAWSAMSRAASMISKPSASCSSVMHSGGLVWIELFGDHRVQAVVAEELADRLHLVATCR